MHLLLPLVVAATAAAAPLPEGMVRVPEGEFFQGRARSDRPDETPRHRVRVSAFLLDETLVTFEAFSKFVAATGYRTSAERLGFGLAAAEGMDDWKWERIPGASFKAPFGPARAKEVALRPDDPVTMVSWEDADAFCRHLGKRLPTEAEWEYAMRAGRSDARFPWGDSPAGADGKLRVNYWQGKTHAHNENRDGFLYFSPVKAFPPNAWGLYDPAGNLWQWVADWYDADSYRAAAREEVALNPRGPAKGTRRVARGGSWWCSDHTCTAYGLWYRGKSKPDAPFNNNGFRCALDGR